MANKYATVVSKAGAVSQDPNEIDLNVTADTGATATPELTSPTVGGGVTRPNMGFAGADAILVIGTYVDDADGSIGSVSEFAPGHGTNTKYANEKLSGLSMGGILPGGQAAVGTLTMPTIPVNTNTVTIGSTVYRFMNTPAQAFDVAIGANVAASQANLVAAINLTGTPGTEYFAGTTEHPDVSVSAFATNVMTATAKFGGLAGDSIATTETIGPADGVWNATTLGATTPGEDFANRTSLEPIGISADVALIDQNA